MLHCGQVYLENCRRQLLAFRTGIHDRFVRDLLTWRTAGRLLLLRLVASSLVCPCAAVSPPLKSRVCPGIYVMRVGYEAGRGWVE